MKKNMRFVSVLMASCAVLSGVGYAADGAPPPPPMIPALIDDVVDTSASGVADENAARINEPAPALPESVVVPPVSAKDVAEPVKQKKKNHKKATKPAPVVEDTVVADESESLIETVDMSGVYSLSEALQETYITNPTLRAARANVRAVAEGLAQAQAGWKPTVNAAGNITYSNSQVDPGSDSNVTEKAASVSLSQPLYRGGRTTAQMRAADALVDAGLATLATTERSVLYTTATAYMDVLTSQAKLKTNEKNRDVIGRQLKATRDRFEVGDVTRTDVSQSEYRLAQAEADVTAARGALQSARAVFEQYVGVVQDKLALPTAPFNFPETLDAAIQTAETYNPDVIAAQAREAAAREDITVEAGGLLPTVALESAIGLSRDPSESIDSRDSASVGVTASMPLYEGGATRARVRAAKYTANEQMMNVLAAKRSAREEVVRAWENLNAAKGELTSRVAQVRAAKIARDGVREEAELGERTILDALDADQDVRDAEIALITAKRNQVVAQYALASALGLLLPGNIGIKEPVFDASSLHRIPADFSTSIVQELDTGR